MDHYDVDRIRSAFPALATGAATGTAVGTAAGIAHFDGPGGSQVPAPVAAAVAETLTSGISNRGSVTAAERRADEVVLGARAAVADLLGARPGGIVFGRSMTQLTYDVARTLARGWRPGDEIVVTRLDHDANIRPWVQAAATAGVTVRWAPFEPHTGELSAAAVTDLFGHRTRLVALTAASNLLGTRPDVAAVTAAARSIGALSYVDGVHLTPHTAIDVVALGCDFYACSPYKWLGPHCGVLVAAPELLQSLHPDKLLASTDAVPERFELGTLPYEIMAGTTAAVDFLADLVPGPGSRRERLLASMVALEQHEDALFAQLLDGLRDLPAVTLHGCPVRRTPTALFSVKGYSAHEVYVALAARGVNAPAGSFYAIEASRWAGLGDAGAVRAGLAPYTNTTDIQRLLAGVGALGP